MSPATMMDQKALQKVLREARPTLDTIAEAVGISRSSLDNYQYRDGSEMPPHVRRRLAQYLEAHGRRLQQLADTVRESI